MALGIVVLMTEGLPGNEEIAVHDRRRAIDPLTETTETVDREAAGVHHQEAHPTGTPTFRATQARSHRVAGKTGREMIAERTGDHAVEGTTVATIGKGTDAHGVAVDLLLVTSRGTATGTETETEIPTEDDVIIHNTTAFLCLRFQSATNFSSVIMLQP
jgi:hypothetical protein